MSDKDHGRKKDRQHPPELIAAIASALLLREQESGGAFGKITYRSKQETEADRLATWYEEEEQ